MACRLAGWHWQTRSVATQVVFDAMALLIQGTAQVGRAVCAAARAERVTTKMREERGVILIVKKGGIDKCCQQDFSAQEY